MVYKSVIIGKKDYEIDDCIFEWESLGYSFIKAEAIEKNKIKVIFLEQNKKIRLLVLEKTLKYVKDTLTDIKKALKNDTRKYTSDIDLKFFKSVEKSRNGFIVDYLKWQKKVETEIKKVENE